jgi:tetratricopeptide (TPR) repeat protein
LLSTFCLLVVSGQIWYGIKVYEKKTGYVTDDFSAKKAEEFFDTDNIDGLLEYCSKFCKKRNQNDVLVNWYTAIGHYQQDRLDAAQTHFERVIRLNPNWKEATLPYLQEIEDAGKGGFSH